MSNRIQRELVVPEAEAGARLDAVLAAACDVPRALAAEWASTGDVQIIRDGKAVKTTKSAKVTENDRLVIDAPAPRDLADINPEYVDGFSVVYQDDDIAVVDKPAGVAAHPSPGWHGPTVVGVLLGAGVSVSTSGASERQGIVHRLDVGTSGLMVVAKNEHSYAELKRAFKERTVEKVYHTLVQGIPDPLKGTIDAPIGRHPGHEWRFAVIEGGRDSVTHYEVLEAYGPASLVEVHLETGRTHQIRVHFSALKHPCLGDLTYGADPAVSANLGLTRQWLHAHKLGFTHPSTGQYVEFESSYPEDLNFAVEQLRDGNF
ncbi:MULTISPECIES: RluA family pseudouridine synthase [unclassified Rothia (in: high G+C Gram-positive bacteria)]|uniref:RluA family pseudouridine synthase n=1 Tax=unclassified Rothia (in: high G+C Gram-positive bacteria) TaxID=2689056 RepID=UPI001957255E|nr:MULTISPECIES: RluA family pseudouridine synthase [unclassified Rothia (in: high G+C Gram-positive bacteria)]MBM7050747.1 RluA family pseudouridine synthase [Rothia sp. ZJ1223]QRZ60929.1 RluA family pseudouridine synthase [Rothia sp. ZJ932]